MTGTARAPPTTTGRGHAHAATRERHHRQGTDASASSPAIAHENGSLRPMIGSSIAPVNGARHGHYRTGERRADDADATVLRRWSTYTRASIAPRGPSRHGTGANRSNVAAHRTPTTRRTQVGSGVRQRANRPGLYVRRRQTTSFPSAPIGGLNRRHRAQFARYQLCQSSWQTEVNVGGRRKPQTGGGA